MVLIVKNLPANAGDVRDTGSIPRWGRSPRGGHGRPLQYSCLENPMDRDKPQFKVLHPLSGLKGVQPPLPFGERTRDCSPGHAGKEGPHFAMTGASHGFSRAATPVWGFSRGTTGSSGSLSCGAMDVRSLCTWRGGARPCSRVMVGESGLKTR